MALVTSLPVTAVNESPPLEERRMPRGPISRTWFASIATTARGARDVPVLRIDQLAPPFVVFSSVPELSSAKPVVSVGNATSTTSSEVETLPLAHVLPPSVLFARAPSSPRANAVLPAPRRSAL